MHGNKVPYSEPNLLGLTSFDVAGEKEVTGELLLAEVFPDKNSHRRDL